mgnify:CR=1 FL=1
MTLNNIFQFFVPKDKKFFPLFEQASANLILLADSLHEAVNAPKGERENYFKKIDELTGLQVFTIDALLAYFVKFIMVEKWQEQDHEKGVQLIKKIIQEPSNE